MSPALAGRFFTTEPQGSPTMNIVSSKSVSNHEFIKTEVLVLNFVYSLERIRMQVDSCDLQEHSTLISS